jgi:hypothetical protein
MASAFERNDLRRMFWGNKVMKIWRKPYNEELLQLFGDLDRI